MLKLTYFANITDTSIGATKNISSRSSWWFKNRAAHILKKLFIPSRCRALFNGLNFIGHVTGK